MSLPSEVGLVEVLKRLRHKGEAHEPWQAEAASWAPDRDLMCSPHRLPWVGGQRDWAVRRILRRVLRFWKGSVPRHGEHLELRLPALSLLSKKWKADSRSDRSRPSADHSPVYIICSFLFCWVTAFPPWEPTYVAWITAVCWLSGPAHRSDVFLHSCVCGQSIQCCHLTQFGLCHVHGSRTPTLL